MLKVKTAALMVVVSALGVTAAAEAKAAGCAIGVGSACQGHPDVHAAFRAGDNAYIEHTTITVVQMPGKYKPYVIK